MHTRHSRRRLLSAVAGVAAMGVAIGCGMRGPPLAPLIFVPDAVADLDVQRLADQAFIQFEVPAENTDRSTPADLERVEVYALTTGSPDDADAARGLPLDEWLEYATLVAEISVLGPDEPVSSVTPLEEPADGSAVRLTAFQGDEVVLTEALTAEVRLPVVIETEEIEDDTDPEDADGAEAPLVVAPLVSPPLPVPPRRTYVAIGVSTRGRESSPSSRVDITLADSTSAPGSPTVTYTESETRVEWSPPLDARLPIQAPNTEETLASTPVVEPPVPTRYLVYAREPEVAAEEQTTDIDVPDPVNIGPVADTAYPVPEVGFGVERCYAVRAVDEIDSLEVVGPPSPEACVVPVDTFPPAPPVGLGAVASPGAVSLVWDPSPEGDVLGYLVLRAAAPGATLQPLTPEPIPDTSYRDADVESGRRYVYAVSAVDDAVPPNVSEPSREVTEEAR